MIIDNRLLTMLDVRYSGHTYTIPQQIILLAVCMYSRSTVDGRVTIDVLR